jgi:DNA adenine methylase
MGSKNKISKYIIPFLIENKKSNQLYIEPFVGGCNMIDKITGKRIGNDFHHPLIEMWKALQNGWIPPEFISKEEYYYIKENQESLDPALVGFAGFLCSFGGKWWGGYAFNKKNDNYAARGRRVLLKQIKLLKDVEFMNYNYINLPIENNSIIYCDPPYKGTTKYSNNFNHEEFWEWCRNISKKNNKIYISEYNAPKDFILLKEIKHKTILDKNSNYIRVEKLFLVP